MRVNHACVDVGSDGFSLNQQVQLVVHAVIRGRQYLADHGIASGRLPVGTRLAFVTEVVNDRPRIEDVGIAEAVAVVPFANLLVLVVGAVVMRHGLDLLVREAEVFAVSVVEDCVDLRVVQTTENAFLGDLENPSQESERQMAVVLESTRKEVSHEVDDGIVEAPHMALMNGRVVFVHDDDRRDPVMLMEQLGKR